MRISGCAGGGWAAVVGGLVAAGVANGSPLQLRPPPPATAIAKPAKAAKTCTGNGAIGGSWGRKGKEMPVGVASGKVCLCLPEIHSDFLLLLVFLCR